MQRIVHLGLGNFHRAHQAWYTACAGGWHITGVAIRNRALVDQLAAYDNCYLLGVWGTDGLKADRICIYDEVLLAAEQSQQVIQKIADEDTHIVTLTVTEKGYYLQPGDNRLHLAAEPIAHDLASDKPLTAIGLLVAGLMQRSNERHGPLTVLSCDNLSCNGSRLRQAVVDYWTEKNPDGLQWLMDNVSFPNTMVDRITPRLDDVAVAEIASAAGVAGLPCVGTEAFSEWIIEDSFVSIRPDWASVGVQLVSDVTSFEERKLRLLNASHTYLAYLGLLGGHQYVHEAIADSAIKAAINALWDEAQVSVSMPAAETLDEYRSALLDRFSVAQLRHELQQIAMDGSLKIRERIIPILQVRSSKRSDSPESCRAVAAWIAYLMKTVEGGATLIDPNANMLKGIVQSSGNTLQCCKQIFRLIDMNEAHVQLVSEQVSSFIAERVQEG